MFLEGKVAIVTAGGGPGMGSTISLALAREGADLVIADVDLGRAKKVAKEVQALGRQALPVMTDVSQKEHVVKMVAEAIDRFGKVSILVNHAGVGPGGPIEAISEETWDHNLAVHLKGSFLCSQAVVPHMKSEGWGRIVSTSSRAAYKPLWSGMSDYSAAKAGIVGLSKALAVELGPWGITANCVAPGGVAPSEGGGETSTRRSMTLEEREAANIKEGGVVEPIRDILPEEIAGAVLYLVGPYSDRITGTVLQVNSGAYMA